MPEAHHGDPPPRPGEDDAPRRQPDLHELLLLLQGRSRYHGVALTALLILGLLFSLKAAASFFLPVVLAFLLSFVLAPVVRGMARLRLPLGLGAALVVLGLLGTLGAGLYWLSNPAADWIENAPRNLRRVERKLGLIKKQVETVSRATQEVEKITQMDDGGGVQEVAVRQPSLADTLVGGARDLVVGAVVMFILLYFLLASGDLFLRKLVRVLPRLTDRKKAVTIARKMESRISTYLFTISLINLGLGAAEAAAMWALGLPNPLLWGAMATLLNFIPYLGAMVGTAVVALVSLVTFDELGTALAPPLVYLAVTAFEGYVVTPTILGRRLTLNPVVVFVALIFWGWMWGIAGALLAVPMLATFKIFCDQIEPLTPLGEFLGR